MKTLALLLLTAFTCFAQVEEMLLTIKPSAGGVAPITDPTEIANCGLWLDASALVGLDGSAVTAVNDGSGNFRHFKNEKGSNEPNLTNDVTTLGGKHALLFKGADWLTNLQMGISASEYDIWIVAQGNGSGGGQQYWFDSETGRLILMYNRTASGNTTSCYDGTSYVDGDACSTSASIVEYYLDAGTGTAKIYRGGVQVGSSGDYATKALGAQTRIGSNYEESGSRYVGLIAEFIIYTRTLTAGERDQVLTYLKTKYSL